MTLTEQNQAVKYQRGMSTENANLYARALPRPQGYPDWEAVGKFSLLSVTDPNLHAAADFLHGLVQPYGMAAKLSGQR